MCGSAMPQVNSDANTPPGAAGVVHLLADDHRVGAVAAAAADGLRAGRRRAGRPRRPCGAARAAARRCAPTRRGAAAPRVRRSARTVSRSCFAFGRVSRWLIGSKLLRDVDVPAAQPLAERPWPAGRSRAWDATPSPSMPSMTKFTARRFGSTCRVTGRSAVSGSSSRSLSTVSVVRQPAPLRRRCAPTPRRWRCRPCRRCGRRRCVPSGTRRGLAERQRLGQRERRDGARAPRSRWPAAMSMRVPSACTATCGTSVGVDVARR